MVCPISSALSHKFSNMSFVCACLVVYIHVQVPKDVLSAGWWLAELMKHGICGIAVPFFFVAAGFFLAGHSKEDGWWGREVKKRVRSLLIPYFLWIFIHLVYTVPFTLMANWRVGVVWTRNLPLDVVSWLRIFGLDPYIYPLFGLLWFVRCLLLFVLLSPLPLALLCRGKGWGIGLLLILAAVYGWQCIWQDVVPGHSQFFWAMTLSLRGAFYFTLGLFLRYWPISLQFPNWCTASLLVIAVGGFIATLLLEQAGVIWASYPRWIGTALALWAVWQLMPDAQWPKWLTATSFPLFLLHSFFLQPLNLLSQNLLAFPHPETNVMVYLAFGAIAILGSITTTVTLRNFFPHVASLLFGGR